MNLMYYRRRWPHLDVRQFMKKRMAGTVPPRPEPPHVRKAMKEWGHKMGKALKQPRREMAALLNERLDTDSPVSHCNCEKAVSKLASHGWFVSACTSRWSHDPDAREVVGGTVTAAQFHRLYYTCAQCSEHHRNPIAISTRDNGMMYCSNWCAEAAGCEQRSGGWYNEDSEGESDWDDCYDDDDDDYNSVQGIYSYCTYLGSLVGSGGKYNIGTEMEIEFPSKGMQRAFVTSITEEFRTHEAHCKGDGSLGQYGVEVVTGYGAWHDMSQTATKICELALACEGKAHLTDSCGQHISIARSGMSCEQQARFVVFFNHPDNQPILKEFARRGQCTWSRVQPDKIDDRFIENSKRNGAIPTGQKYEAVNCNHDSHLEVRIFKGSLRAATVIARMALVHLVATFCEKDLTASELRMPGFFEWLATQDGPEATSVKEYLVHRKQNIPVLA
jgi:hypothetical protein